MSEQRDGRVLRGEQTRASVLERAVGIASVEGLDALSIGRLASEAAVSKSGVFARFGSKEDLQLATIEAAAEIFADRVVAPAFAVPPGIGRLWELCAGWLGYSRARTFPGGCFFYAVAAEYDARPGRVRDAIATTRAGWTTLLERAVDDARQLGDLAEDTDTARLAFELDALGAAANARSLLHDDDTAYDLARAAMLTRLRAAATDPATLPAAMH
jgi:AcrR family transcriptional regulator